AAVTYLQRRPVLRAPVLDVVDDGACHVACDHLPCDGNASGRRVGDQCERLHAQVELAFLALGALVRNAHGDHAFRARDLHALAANLAVRVLGGVHRGDVQVIGARVEAAVAAPIGVVERGDPLLCLAEGDCAAATASSSPTASSPSNTAPRAGGGGAG